MFDFEFQGQWSRSQYWYICFWIQRHRFSTYRHQTQVSKIYTTRDIILNALCQVWPWISRSKVKVTILAYIFWILLHRFSTHRQQKQVFTIYYQRYHIECVVMFDLEFQGQRSRSQYWYIFFWIPRHWFSTYRDQTQVSTIYTTRDIILNALCHVWPWISRSKVKVTTMRHIVLNSLTSV